MADASMGDELFEERTSMFVGRVGSFEIIIDDKYVAWSKLATHEFPNPREMSQAIAAYASTGKVPKEWTEIKTDEDGDDKEDK